MRTLPAESFLPAGVGENCKKLQGKFLRIISSESPAKLYCCYAVIAILATSVIALSVALSGITKPEAAHANCPRDWIGFGSKCFYFSKDMTNWPSSQTFCMAQEAHLAQFDSLEELNFLIRYKGDSTHWIGLHRETSQNPWRWTDSTKYNNLVPIRGEGQYAYLSDRGISSGKEYMPRKWICSKPNSYLQCPVVSQLVSKQS
ncbi:C-type lectin domain family 2 member D11-like isoform X1 [Peromyscus leucopus]|uniref:C-type lectin domain family 2 member D11-like isoform X1 n=1 Tax=Peromyscus leucopus TaxID=10041 RepID=UPI0018857848|nr:C-type lectin domain family 2 member D11-like isoform X1 [Peromyscus leucopus]